ncbi:hypothetical protein GCM10023322_31050 [Rugosimonospora acidiphila]|uniref:Peptidase S8/S53 domain-containing protein n=1 Tax=Rugosimonospora acidiphila TaxID=556531 RepID=A0ABP9RRT0_9ACTN
MKHEPSGLPSPLPTLPPAIAGDNRATRRSRLARIAVAAPVSLAAAIAAVAGVVTPASAAPTEAPAYGSAVSGGSVIVVLKNQHSDLNLRTQGDTRRAAAFADQAPLLADIRSHGGTGVSQLVSVNAIAATVSADEVARLRADAAVAQIVPDTAVPLAPAPASQAAAPAAATPAVQKPSTAATCPTVPGEKGKPAQEPEAMADIHASTGNPNSPEMANSIATGKGVIVAIGGMNRVAGNPDFQRADGSHVVMNAPDYTADTGSDESYGDASSVAAQGNMVYNYAQALPFSNVPADCTFTIRGDAPDASLVDSSQIDTPPSEATEQESQLIANVDNAVVVEHADVISESYGYTPRPGNYAVHYAANDAAVAAGVTVVVSSGDSGSSGTISSPASDPNVIAAGAVDNFRLVAMAHGYSSYVSNNIAALSSGGTTPDNKLVDLVAPGYFGEADCSDGHGGCPPNYPTESMRGTSESAPLIAGAAADVIQAYRDTHAGASPTPAQVKQILTGTATDLGAPADQQGAGLLNIYNAVKAAQVMPDTAGRRPAPPLTLAGSLVPSPSQLDLTGNPGSTTSTSVNLYNTSSLPTRVSGTYRELGSAKQIGHTVTENISAPDPSLPLPAEGAVAGAPIHFTVPIGLDRLNADMIWPDPTNSNIICFALIDPQGRLEQLSYDDGSAGRNGAIGSVSNEQNAQVTNPEPGVWTAKILWSGKDVDLAVAPATPGTYTGPMSFKVSGQNWTYKPATTHPVTIPAHSTATVPLNVSMPTAAGDHPESVQFTSITGAVTSLPVARRTLIPSQGGSFNTVITSTVGRSVGQVSTYNMAVSAGTKSLNLNFNTADASPDNKFTFYLLNPTGTVVATDTTPKTVDGQAVATATLSATDPTPGTWEIDVVLNLTESGKEFTQTVYGQAAVTH